jgi:glycerate kinase
MYNVFSTTRGWIGMRIVIVPDSYKGSLNSKQVADCMEEGILDVLPEAEVVKIPIADGGEGTVEAIISAVGVQYREQQVTGPLGKPVIAVYGVLDDCNTAIIEIASASGLPLMTPERLNPLHTTSYGTGQLIQAALDQGCRKMIIGIGGSATNDGGVGMAQALGIRFLDNRGDEIGFGGGELNRIKTIDMTGIDERISSCEFTVASDVKNPLCGPNGASAIFGPQNGATPEMVPILDNGLFHLSQLLCKQLGLDLSTVEGAGAAGGLGFGLMAFLNASMHRGIDIILEITKFEEIVQHADLVITGEGRTDEQTAFGKTPAGVASIAKKYNKPVVCISGGIALELQPLHNIGLDAIIGATLNLITEWNMNGD